MQFFSDSVSEKYRKYVLCFKYDTKSLFTLYSTDLSSTQENDELMVDSRGSILTFKSGDRLKKYILETTRLFLFDRKNASRWAREHSAKKAYSVCDLDSVYSIVDQEISITSLAKTQATGIIYFINLFGDYAYQTQNKEYLNLHDKKSARVFFDFYYDNYVWDTIGQLSYKSLQELDYLQFDASQFGRDIKNMITTFMSKVVIID